MNLFDTSLKLSGFPITEAQALIQKIDAIPESDYEDYIKKSRATIVQHHWNHNPYYRKFLKNQKPERWEDIPTMKKSDLQIPLEERLSKGFTPKNTFVNKTSGSSGHPFVFAKDKLCHAITWARVKDIYKKQNIDIGVSLEARFYGIPLDFWGNTKERFKDVLGKRERFPIFDLSEQKMEIFLERFKTKKFEIINGYTSSIVLFAKFLHSKSIVLKSICPSLRTCIVTSEMLFESDKILLEQALGVPILNEYGASELGVMAFTNSEGQFQLNTQTLYIELLDEENRPVPVGSPGKVVVTALYNKAHPMIRYEIGDYAVFAPKTAVKYQYLEKLVGRTNDVAVLPNGKKVPGLTFYYVTKSVIENDGNVKEFIVEQHSIDRFIILYVAQRELSKKDIENIEKALDTYVESKLHIKVIKVPMLDRSSRGKLKQFIKKF